MVIKKPASSRADILRYQQELKQRLERMKGGTPPAKTAEAARSPEEDQRRSEELARLAERLAKAEATLTALKGAAETALLEQRLAEAREAVAGGNFESAAPLVGKLEADVEDAAKAYVRDSLWRCESKVVELEMVGIDVGPTRPILDEAKAAQGMADWSAAVRAARRADNEIDSLQRAQVLYVIEAAEQIKASLDDRRVDAGTSGNLPAQARQFLDARDYDKALDLGIKANEELKEIRNKSLASDLRSVGELLERKQKSGVNVAEARRRLAAATVALKSEDFELALESLEKARAIADPEEAARQKAKTELRAFQARLEELAKEGLALAPVRDLMSEAEAALARGDISGYKGYIDVAGRTLEKSSGRFREVQSRLAEVQALLQEYEPLGGSYEGPRSLVDETRSAIELGDFEIALDYATQAIEDVKSTMRLLLDDTVRAVETQTKAAVDPMIVELRASLQRKRRSGNPAEVLATAGQIKERYEALREQVRGETDRLAELRRVVDRVALNGVRVEMVHPALDEAATAVERLDPVAAGRALGTADARLRRESAKVLGATLGRLEGRLAVLGVRGYPCPDGEKGLADAEASAREGDLWAALEAAFSGDQAAEVMEHGVVSWEAERRSAHERLFEARLVGIPVDAEEAALDRANAQAVDGKLETARDAAAKLAAGLAERSLQAVRTHLSETEPHVVEAQSVVEIPAVHDRLARARQLLEHGQYATAQQFAREARDRAQSQRTLFNALSADVAPLKEFLDLAPDFGLARSPGPAFEDVQRALASGDFTRASSLASSSRTAAEEAYRQATGPALEFVLAELAELESTGLRVAPLREGLDPLRSLADQRQFDRAATVLRKVREGAALLRDRRDDLLGRLAAADGGAQKLVAGVKGLEPVTAELSSLRAKIGTGDLDGVAAALDSLAHLQEGAASSTATDLVAVIRQRAAILTELGYSATRILELVGKTEGFLRKGQAAPAVKAAAEALGAAHETVAVAEEGQKARESLTRLLEIGSAVGTPMAEPKERLRLGDDARSAGAYGESRDLYTDAAEAATTALTGTLAGSFTQLEEEIAREERNGLVAPDLVDRIGAGRELLADRLMADAFDTATQLREALAERRTHLVTARETLKAIESALDPAHREGTVVLGPAEQLKGLYGLVAKGDLERVLADAPALLANIAELRAAHTEARDLLGSSTRRLAIDDSFGLTPPVTRDVLGEARRGLDSGAYAAAIRAAGRARLLLLQAECDHAEKGGRDVDTVSTALAAAADAFAAGTWPQAKVSLDQAETLLEEHARDLRAAQRAILAGEESLELAARLGISDERLAGEIHQARAAFVAGDIRAAARAGAAGWRGIASACRAEVAGVLAGCEARLLSFNGRVPPALEAVLTDARAKLAAQDLAGAHEAARAALGAIAKREAQMATVIEKVRTAEEQARLAESFGLDIGDAVPAIHRARTTVEEGGIEEGEGVAEDVLARVGAATSARAGTVLGEVRTMVRSLGERGVPTAVYQAPLSEAEGLVAAGAAPLAITSLDGIRAKLETVTVQFAEHLDRVKVLEGRSALARTRNITDTEAAALTQARELVAGGDVRGALQLATEAMQASDARWRSLVEERIAPLDESAARAHRARLSAGPASEALASAREAVAAGGFGEAMGLVDQAKERLGEIEDQFGEATDSVEAAELLVDLAIRVGASPGPLRERLAEAKSLLDAGNVDGAVQTGLELAETARAAAREALRTGLAESKATVERIVAAGARGVDQEFLAAAERLVAAEEFVDAHDLLLDGTAKVAGIGKRHEDAWSGVDSLTKALADAEADGVEVARVLEPAGRATRSLEAGEYPEALGAVEQGRAVLVEQQQMFVRDSAKAWRTALGHLEGLPVDKDLIGIVNEAQRRSTNDLPGALQSLREGRTRFSTSLQQALDELDRRTVAIRVLGATTERVELALADARRALAGGTLVQATASRADRARRALDEATRGLVDVIAAEVDHALPEVAGRSDARGLQELRRLMGALRDRDPQQALQHGQEARIEVARRKTEVALGRARDAMTVAESLAVPVDRARSFLVKAESAQTGQDWDGALSAATEAVTTMEGALAGALRAKLTELQQKVDEAVAVKIVLPEAGLLDAAAQEIAKGEFGRAKETLERGATGVRTTVERCTEARDLSARVEERLQRLTAKGLDVAAAAYCHATATSAADAGDYAKSSTEDTAAESELDRLDVKTLEDRLAQVSAHVQRRSGKGVVRLRAQEAMIAEAREQLTARRFDGVRSLLQRAEEEADRRWRDHARATAALAALEAAFVEPEKGATALTLRRFKKQRAAARQALEREPVDAADGGEQPVDDGATPLVLAAPTLVAQYQERFEESITLDLDVATGRKIVKLLKDALSAGDYEIAIEHAQAGVRQLMGGEAEAVRRTVVLIAEEVAALSADGLDPSLVETFLSRSVDALREGDHEKAVKYLHEAQESARSLRKDGTETRETFSGLARLCGAGRLLGADVTAAEQLLRTAEESFGTNDFETAADLAGQGIADARTALRRALDARAARIGDAIAAARTSGVVPKAAENLHALGQGLAAGEEEQLRADSAFDRAQAALQAALERHGGVATSIAEIRKGIDEAGALGIEAKEAVAAVREAEAAMAAGSYALDDVLAGGRASLAAGLRAAAEKMVTDAEAGAANRKGRSVPGEIASLLTAARSALDAGDPAGAIRRTRSYRERADAATIASLESLVKDARARQTQLPPGPGVKAGSARLEAAASALARRDVDSVESELHGWEESIRETLAKEYEAAHQEIAALLEKAESNGIDLPDPRRSVSAAEESEKAGDLLPAVAQIKEAVAAGKRDVERHIADLLITVEDLLNRSEEFRAEAGRPQELFDEAQQHIQKGRTLQALETAIRCKKESDTGFRKGLSMLIKEREELLRRTGKEFPESDMAPARAAIDQAKRSLLGKQWNETLQALTDAEGEIDRARGMKTKEKQEVERKQAGKKRLEQEVKEMIELVRTTGVDLGAEGISVAGLLKKTKTAQDIFDSGDVEKARETALACLEDARSLQKRYRHAQAEYDRAMARVEKLREKGLDVTEAEDLLGVAAHGDIQSGSFDSALEAIQQAEAVLKDLESGPPVAKAPDVPGLAEAKASLQELAAAGVHPADAERMIEQAEAAAGRGDVAGAGQLVVVARDALSRGVASLEPDLSIDFELRAHLEVGKWTAASLFMTNVGKAAATGAGVKFSGGLFGKKVEGLEVLPGETRELEILVKPTNLGDVQYRIVVSYRRKSDGKDFKTALDRRVYVHEKPVEQAATVGTCAVCTGEIAGDTPMIRCTCGKTYHESCASSVVNCPTCQRPLQNPA